MERNRVGTRTATGAALLVTAGLIAATNLSGDDHSAALAEDEIVLEDRMAFVKFDGVDGEATDPGYDTWVNASLFQWGSEWPRNRHGAMRRRGSAVVGDVELTVEYDKATPKLQEKCLKGEVIPKVEIEQTALYGGGQRQVYLRYQLINVVVADFVVASGGQAPDLSKVSLNFEEVKVTYTEREDDGSSKGNVQFEYHVE